MTPCTHESVNQNSTKITTRKGRWNGLEQVPFEFILEHQGKLIFNHHSQHGHCHGFSRSRLSKHSDALVSQSKQRNYKIFVLDFFKGFFFLRFKPMYIIKVHSVLQQK